MTRRLVVAGTGSRSLALESREVRDAALEACRHWLSYHRATLVLSGGAEGWDACLAAAAFAEGIPYHLILPNAGYLDHYWRRKSITGTDRSSAAARMCDRAANVVHVTDGALYVPDPHDPSRTTHANFARNCRLLGEADMGLVYDPSSAGTRHGVSELRRHNVAFRIWNATDGWTFGDPPATGTQPTAPTMTLHDAAKFVATHGAPELLPAGLQNNLALASCANELDRAFRAASLVLHPDHGGNATDFATLVVARDLLRAAASR